MPSSSSSKTSELASPYKPPNGVPPILEAQMQLQKRRAYLMRAESRKKHMHTIGAMALEVSGISFIAFSALMQFSPQFILILGCNLSPIALISVAAIGVLLLSVGIYQAYKASTISAATPSVIAKPNAAKLRDVGIWKLNSQQTPNSRETLSYLINLGRI